MYQPETPTRRWRFWQEGACITEHRRASVVELLDLDSRFMESFSTAVAAEALLMTNVDVIWRAEKPLAKI